MKTSYLMTGVLLVSAQGYAGVLGQPGIQALQRELKTSSSQEQCVSLAGRWEGQCQTTGQAAEAESLTIAQSGCAYLVVNGRFAAVGGTVSESHAIPLEGGDLHYAASTNLSWNEAKSALLFVTQAALHKTGAGVVYADRIAGYATLHEGKLVSYAKGKDTETVCRLAPAGN
jgi:hypothetical protein